MVFTNQLITEGAPPCSSKPFFSSTNFVKHIYMVSAQIPPLHLLHRRRRWWWWQGLRALRFSAAAGAWGMQFYKVGP